MLEDQMARVVSTLDRLATNQVELDNALSTLADAHIKTQQQFRQTDALFRQTDARIDRLVLGIGDLIRAMSERKQ
jgi:hypothetical protein